MLFVVFRFISIPGPNVKMTKRACPFEVGVLRQFKVHVNNIECDKASMKDIQNKTVEKLFSAQKNNFTNKMNNNFQVKSRNLLQKHVDSYFSTKSGKSVKKDAGNAESDISLPNGISNCSYCDSKTGNTYTCRSCFESYCQNCSFADYTTGNDETRICITCS